MWDDLKELKTKFIDGDWCLCGDFNYVISSSKRKGSQRYGRRSENEGFKEFMEELDLIDVPYFRNKLTWFSGDGKSMRRIGIFCLSSSLIDRWVWWVNL